MPDSKPKIYAALGKVMKGLNVLEKAEYNKWGNYRYRGIDSLLNHAHTLLADAGLVVLPHCLTDNPHLELGPLTEKGKQQYTIVLKMAFEFISTEDGSTVTSGPFIGEGLDSADKCSNKAQTAAFKWCFFQTFCVPVSGGLADSEEPNEIDQAGQTTPPERPAPKKGKQVTPLDEAREFLLARATACLAALSGEEPTREQVTKFVKDMAKGRDIKLPATDPQIYMDLAAVADKSASQPKTEDTYAA